MKVSLPFLLRRVVASITALSFALQPILAPIAAAQQITDPRAPIQFRPSTAVSGNGTPVVNITTPSFGGISHNKFERYNVDTRGVILNNSGYNGTSVIGGAVTANPNLVGRPTARVILNEVTGTTASTLNGPTEVFGSRADVIIANPNGVGCIGCTFINAGRITLSTGVPNPDYTLGTVRYSVTGGTVSVSGSGLKGGGGENLGNIDLIGRQIRVEGPLEARGAVRLRAGAIDYDQGIDSVTALAGAAGVAGPAISSSVAGTIKAGTLSVLSQDVDLGVALDGGLTALAGDIAIRSRGAASVAGASATTDIAIEGDGAVYLSGRKEAIGRLSLRARSVVLDVSSSIAANSTIVMEALEGLVARGTLQSGQDISLTSGGSLVASGTITALGRVVLEGNSIFTANLGVSGSHLTLAGLTTLTLNNTGLRAQSDIALLGDDLALGSGTAFDAGGTLRIIARNSLNNQTILDYPHLDLVVRNQLIVSATGAIVQDILLLNVRDSIDNQGTLYGTTSATLNTGTLSNSATGVIYGGDVAVNLSGTLTNLGRVLSSRTLNIVTTGLVQNNSLLHAQGNLTLKAATYQANSVDAVLAGANSLIITSGAFENLGRVLGTNSLTLRAASLANAGTLASGGFASLTTSGDIRNTGSIGAQGDLTIGAGGAIVSPGHIVSQAGALSITATGAVKSGGDLIAAGRVYLRAASFESTAVTSRLAGNAIDAGVTGEFTNLGLVSSSGWLRLDVGRLNNGPSLANTLQGTILGDGLNLTSTGDIINQGAILAQNRYYLQAGGGLDNSGTLNGGAGAQLLVSGAVTNNGAIAFHDALVLSGGSYAGGAGSALQADGITASFTGALQNAGTIVSTAGLTIAATDLSLLGTRANLTAQTITLNLQGGLTNEGQIGATNTLSIAARGNVNSSGAILTATGAIDLTTAGQVNASGDIVSGAGVNLQAAGYNGTTTARLGGTSITLALGAGDLTNAGLISTGGALDIGAANLANSGALYGQNITARLSGNLTNSNILASTQDLTINAAGGLNNTSSGQIKAAGSAGLTFGAAVTNNGAMAANNSLTLRSASYLASDAAASLSALTLAIHTSGDFDTAGRVIGQNSLALEAGNFALRGASQMLGGAIANLTLHGNALNEGNIVGTNQLTLLADRNITNSGLIQSDTGHLTLHAASAITNSGGIAAFRNIDLAAASLTNSGAGSRIDGNDVVINLSGGLTNAGKILAANNLAVHAGDLTNAAAALILGKTSDLILSGQGRNDGAIQSLTNLTLQSLSHFQNFGQIAANDNATLTIGGDLANAGKLLVNTNITIQAANITNFANAQVGGTNTTITSCGNVLNNGSIFADDRLQIRAGGDLRNAGTLQANGLTADIARMIDNAGTIKAGWADLTSRGTLSNSGLLQSLSDLKLTVSGALQNVGTITAANISDIRAASVLNAAGANIDATQLSLTLGGSLENHGKLAASDLLVIKAGTLLNQGVASSLPAHILADRLSVTVTGALNNRSDSLLQGTSTAQVSAGSVNDGFLTNLTQAQGRFNYSNNLDLTLTNSGYTFNDALTVAGNLRFVTSDDIVNNATVAAGGNLVLGTTAGSILNKENAVLYSVGDMALNAANSVINTAGTIQSYANMFITAGGEVRNERGTPKLTWETIEQGLAANAAGEPRIYYVQGKRLWKHLIVYQIDSSRPATLYAGSNLTITANAITNDASNIIVGGDFTARAQSFSNSIRTYEAGDHYWKITGKDKGYRGFNTFSGTSRSGAPGNSSTPAVISVGGVFDAVASSAFTNTGSIDAQTAKVYAPSVTVGITNPNINAHIARSPGGTIDLAAYLPVSAQGISLPGTSRNIGIPTAQILPRDVKASVAAPTLPKASVRTASITAQAPESTLSPQVLPANPASAAVPVTYLNASPLPGTNERQPTWILNQVGDSRSDLTFFADPATERRLIQQAMVEQTGRSLIDPAYRNPQAQQEAMYQGAVEFLKTHPELHLGDKLTEEQRKSITAPILWYENRVINGQNVLMPQVILPQSLVDRYSNRGAGTIVADNVSIDADNFINTGNITAQQDLTISATTLINEQRTGAWSMGKSHGNALIDGGLLSGRNVTLTALDSITAVGGTISGSANVTLSAVNAVSIVPQIVESTLVTKKGKVTTTSSKLTNVAAVVEAGDTLTITSTAGDILLKASQLTGQRINLSAQGMVAMLTATDTSAFSKKGTREGLVTNKMYDNGRYDETLLYNQIATGAGGLKVSAAEVYIDYEAGHTSTSSRQKHTSTTSTIHAVDGDSSPSAILASLSAQTGLGWMAQLSQDPSQNIIYNGITTHSQSWNNDRTTLSPAMSALISLVASVVVPGLGSMLGGALGMGSLTSILSGVLGNTLGSMAATGLSAFASSFVSNAVISGINGDFDLSRILTSALASGLTAGLTAGAMDFVNTTLIPQVSSAPGLEWLGNAITSQGPPNLEQILTSGLVRTLVSAPISAGVNSLLLGADFGQGLLNGLRNGLAANVLQPGLMFAVGDLGLANAFADGGIEKTLLHASVGALGGAIMGGGRGALGGALGAGLSELLVPNIAPSLNLTQDGERTLSQLIGGMGSLIARDGSLSGATSALNGFEYNRMLHPSETALIRANAVRFAVSQGWCPSVSDCHPVFIRQAEAQLTAQALRDVEASASGIAQNDSAETFIRELARTTPILRPSTSNPYEQSQLNNQLLFSTASTREYQDTSINQQYYDSAADLYRLADVLTSPGLVNGLLENARATDTQNRINNAYSRAMGPWEVFNGVFAGFYNPMEPVRGGVEPATLEVRNSGNPIPPIGRPDFYIRPDGSAVPGTGYRAVTGQAAVDEALSGVVSSRPGGTYITFNSLTNVSAGEVQSLLQLPRTPNGYVSFDTKQILNNLTIPNGRWGSLSTPEPITRTFPEWGTGGGTQAVTNSPLTIDSYRGFQR